MSQSEEKQTSKWWEFYAVRYAMGAVIGGVVFFFLCVASPMLRPLIFGAESGAIDGTKLALFAGYGLTYCYIASAPILVFHVCRYLYKAPNTLQEILCHLLYFIVLPAIAALFFLFYFQESERKAFYAFSFYIAALVLIPQYVGVFITMCHPKKLFIFYQKLSNKRHDAKGEIVESYRHMREHGNSFAIVLLEIIFAVSMYAVGVLFIKPSSSIVNDPELIFPYIVFLVIWVTPAALVWVIGTLFEREFSGV